MPVYRVLGTVSYGATVEIEAEDAEEAIRLAENELRESRLSLERDDFLGFVADESNDPEEVP